MEDVNFDLYWSQQLDNHLEDDYEPYEDFDEEHDRLSLEW